MYPAIKGALVGQPLGNTLAGINNPISQSQLAVINAAPDSYFEQAGEMVLNGTLPGETIVNSVYSAPEFEIALNPVYPVPVFDYNGKPSVIYIGATSCLWCGENRWAMAMALSRFGNFSSLYTGYSAIHDQDLPTLYWNPQDIKTTSGSANFGNFYSSKYINFFSAEYDSNISAGFQFVSTANPLQYFVARAPNASYSQAMAYMNGTKAFAGTPFTLWGQAINRGADGIDLGSAQNASVAASGIPLTYMTHQQIFNQLKSFNTTFAQEEYAVADVYIAQLCPALNDSAPICSLPAIQTYINKMTVP